MRPRARALKRLRAHQLAASDDGFAIRINRPKTYRPIADREGDIVVGIEAAVLEPAPLEAQLCGERVKLVQRFCHQMAPSPATPSNFLRIHVHGHWIAILANMCKYYAHMAERFNTPEDARELGLRLRSARKKKGLTLAKLGKEARVHHGQISRIERGKMATLGKNVHVLCKVLGVSPAAGVPRLATSHLGTRIDALVAALPASEPAMARLIDALEDLVEPQRHTTGHPL